MKKKYLFILLIISLLLPTANIKASNQTYARCFISMGKSLGSVGPNKAVYFPIASVIFDFTGYACFEGTVEGAKAEVYSGDEIIATGAITAWTTNAEVVPPDCYVTVDFESPLTLPKGNKYRLVVPSGTVKNESDPADLNEEFSVEFEVPAVYMPEETSVPARGEVVSTGQLGFGSRFGIDVAKDGEVILSRKDIPLKKYSIQQWNSDNVMYAGIDFGKNVSFEKGVEYAIQVSAGCVAAKYRPDIVNDANSLTLSFIGGGETVSDPVEFNKSSMNEFRKNCEEKGVFGEISFFYNRDVALTLKPTVQLEEDGKVIKEVVPTLSEENGEWVMTADFGNAPVNAGKKYSVVIPEATLFSEEGVLLVNPRKVLSVSGSTGVQEIEETGFAVRTENGVVTVEGVQEGMQVSLYALDGRQVYGAVAEGGTITIPVTAPGVYVLKAGEKTRKITVK